MASEQKTTFFSINRAYFEMGSDHSASGPPHAPLPYRQNRQQQLPLQSQSGCRISRKEKAGDKHSIDPNMKPNP